MRVVLFAVVTAFLPVARPPFARQIEPLPIGRRTPGLGSLRGGWLGPARGAGLNAAAFRPPLSAAAFLFAAVAGFSA